MFEYDRLALDVAEQVARVRQQLATDAGRNFDPEPARTKEQTFDCASSGYGSPGFASTPIASPVPSGGDRHFRRRRQSSLNNDMGFFDFDWFDGNALLTSVGEKQAFIKPRQSMLVTANEYHLLETNKQSPVAEQDGFTIDEIEQFAALLSCPRKEPPIMYQCHICYKTGHYINDCPMRFTSPYQELTPYQGRKKCYGEFQCSQCKRKWTSQNSVANEAQSCIKCHVPVFPHKQLPVDKATAMGLMKLVQKPTSKMFSTGLLHH